VDGVCVDFSGARLGERDQLEDDHGNDGYERMLSGCVEWSRGGLL
jgi:hypothetical protein